MRNFALATALACMASAAFAETKITISAPDFFLKELETIEAELNEALWQQGTREEVRLLEGDHRVAFSEFCQELTDQWRHNDGQVDILITDRIFGASSVESCGELGNRGAIELTLGHYAPMLINSWDSLDVLYLSDLGNLRTNYSNFTTSELFYALANEIMHDGTISPNPYRTWSEINPIFPNEPIFVNVVPYSSIWRVMMEGCKSSGSFDGYLTLGLTEDEAAEKCQETHVHRVAAINLEIAMLRAMDEHALVIVNTNDFLSVSDPTRWYPDFFVSKLNDSFPTGQAIVDGEYPAGGAIRAYFRTSDLSDQFQSQPSPTELLADLIVKKSVTSNKEGLNSFGFQIDPRWANFDDLEKVLRTKATPCPKPKKSKCPTPVGSFSPDQ